MKTKSKIEEKKLTKAELEARENYAFNCPKCNHHKPKLEVNLHTDENGQNPLIVL